MMRWSLAIQGIELLDRSRELRFRDQHADLLLRVLDVGSARTIVELGCGPGAFARALARWLGQNVQIVGIDLDPRFLHHARCRASDDRLPNVHFVEGDALSLPLRDDSVDACLSYTVIEHLPNEQFIREQARVCRPGGRVIAMLTLPEKSLTSLPDGWPPRTARERELWDQLRDVFESAEALLAVGRHWPDPAELPRVFEEMGLTNVRVDALALPVVADDARLTAEQQAQIVETDLRISLERIAMAGRALEAPLNAEVDELRQLVTARFAKRLEAAERGQRVWDYSISFVLAVSGQR